MMLAAMVFVNAVSDSFPVKLFVKSCQISQPGYSLNLHPPTGMNCKPFWLPCVWPLHDGFEAFSWNCLNCFKTLKKKKTYSIQNPVLLSGFSTVSMWDQLLHQSILAKPASALRSDRSTSGINSWSIDAKLLHCSPSQTLTVIVIDVRPKLNALLHWRGFRSDAFIGSRSL